MSNKKLTRNGIHRDSNGKRIMRTLVDFYMYDLSHSNCDRKKEICDQESTRRKELYGFHR